MLYSPFKTFRLKLDHTGEFAVFFYKRCGRTLFRYRAVFQHNDFVGARYRAHTMCNNKDGLILIRRERAVCIAVSFSTSRLAVASSSKIMGASFKMLLRLIFSDVRLRIIRIRFRLWLNSICREAFQRIRLRLQVLRRQ